MVRLWSESEASDMSRPNVRVITKSDFLGLSEEDRGGLLGDFLIIKDTSVSSEFFPRSAIIVQRSVARLIVA